MKPQTTIKIFSIVAFVLLESSYGSKTDISLCINIENDKNRLACFDKITKQDKNNQAILQKNKSTSSSKKGLKKNDRIDKLVNTDSNIEGVYSSISNQIKKDKFESTKEYQSRLKKPKFNTYAVMEEDGQKKYDADKKLYKVCFNGPSSIRSSKLYYRGDSTKRYELGSPSKDDLKISFTTSSKKSTVPMSNNFGVTANVTKNETTSHAIHTDNFKSIMKKKNIVTTSHKDHSFIKTTCVNIPANREVAKQMENYHYVVKMGVTFRNIRTKLYQDGVVSEATIASPSSSTHRTWGFDGHINEFVIYNKTTKEILFSYTD